MSFSLGGSKQKSSQTQNQVQNQTSTFTPNAQYLGMVQGGLDSALGLIGGYDRTTGADVQNYLNPYMDTITDGLARQASIAANGNDAQAAAAGAFGGSGWGLLRGETQRGYADAQAQALAQGYNTAQQAAMSENQAAQAYDLAGLQSYLSGLGLLGNWGTTNTSGTSNMTGSSKGSGFNWGFAGKL